MKVETGKKTLCEHAKMLSIGKVLRKVKELVLEDKLGYTTRTCRQELFLSKIV